VIELYFISVFSDLSDFFFVSVYELRGLGLEVYRSALKGKTGKNLKSAKVT
jgi:hypothetical protein